MGNVTRTALLFLRDKFQFGYLMLQLLLPVCMRNAPHAIMIIYLFRRAVDVVVDQAKPPLAGVLLWLVSVFVALHLTWTNGPCVATVSMLVSAACGLRMPPTLDN